MSITFLKKFFLNNDLATNSEKYGTQLSTDLDKLKSKFNKINPDKFKDVFQAEMRFIDELKNKIKEDNNNITLIYYHLIGLLNVINNLKLNYCIKDAINNYNEVLKNLAQFELWIVNVLHNAMCLSVDSLPNKLTYKVTSKTISQFIHADLLAAQPRFLIDIADSNRAVASAANIYCNFVGLMAVSEEVKDQASSLQLTRNDQSNFEKSKALFGKLSDTGSLVMLALEKDLVRLHFEGHYLTAEEKVKLKYEDLISARYENKYRSLVNSLRDELNAKAYGSLRRFFSRKVHESKQSLVEAIANAAGDPQKNPAECFNDLQRLLRQTTVLDRTVRKICAKYSKNFIDWLVNRNAFNSEILDNIVNIFLNPTLSSEYIDQFIPKLIANFTSLNAEQKIKFVWRLHLLESKQNKLMPQVKSLILSIARDVDISKDFSFDLPVMSGELIQVRTTLQKLILQRNAFSYQKLRQPEQTVQFDELLSSAENRRISNALCLGDQALDSDQIRTEYLSQSKLANLESKLLDKLKENNILIDKLTPTHISKLNALVANHPGRPLSIKVANLLVIWHDALQRFELRKTICCDENHNLLWLLTRELTIDFIVASKVDVAECKQGSKRIYHLAGRLVSDLPLSFIKRFQGSEEFKCYGIEPDLNLIGLTRYPCAELIAEDIAAKLIVWLGAAVKQVQPEDLSLFVKYIKEKILLTLSDTREPLVGKITTYCLERVTQPLSAQAHQFMLTKLTDNSKIKQFEEMLCANQYQVTLVTSDQGLYEQVKDITAENKLLVKNVEQLKQQLAERGKQAEVLAQKLEEEVQLRTRIQKEQQAQLDTNERGLREKLQQADKTATELQAKLAGVASDLEAQNEQNRKLAEELNRLKVQQGIISSKLMTLEANDVIQTDQNDKLNQDITVLKRQREKLLDVNVELKAQLQNHAQRGEHLQEQLVSMSKQQELSSSHAVQQVQQTQQEIEFVKQQVEQLQEITKLWDGFKQDFEQLKNDLLTNNENKLKEQQPVQTATQISVIEKTEPSEVSASAALVADKTPIVTPQYVHALREFIKVEKDFCQNMQTLHGFLLKAKSECEKSEYKKYGKLKEDLLGDEIISVYKTLATDALDVADINLEDITQETFSKYMQQLREAVISPGFLVIRLASLHKATLYYDRYFGGEKAKEVGAFIKQLDQSLKTEKNFIQYNIGKPFQLCMRLGMQFENICSCYKQNTDKDPNTQSTLERLRHFFKHYADRVNDFNKKNEQTIKGSDNKKFNNMMQQLDTAYTTSTGAEATPSGKKYPQINGAFFQPPAASTTDGGNVLDRVTRALFSK